jgi:DNA adenine methylase
MTDEEVWGDTVKAGKAGKMDKLKVVNVASVTHRSPFRYPGGKTWLVPRVRQWIDSLGKKPDEFIEPFAGGGIVGLSMVFDDLVGHATFVELDADIAAVWRTMLNGGGPELAERIGAFDVSIPSVRGVLDTAHRKLIDRAFATIIRNRMQRGGIMAPGASLMREGENGRGLASRWYPETLKRRILDIVRVKKRISFVQGDGIEVIRKNSRRNDAVFFIDPPYTVAGRRLYAHSEIDHEELFRVTSKVSGDFLMTYDNAPPIMELAKKYGFDTHEVAMKNTHHAVMSELLIGRNLDWSRT